ncbi:MAG: hypothetical protein HY331_00420 [Chloroflexi bacterium]|nr:hypothetical protein [Chloroflexota bacterium]
MIQHTGNAKTNQRQASAWRTGLTAALVALVGFIVWSQSSATGDLAPMLGLPAFFLGITLWLVDLGVRGRDGQVVLNRFLVAGEDLFIAWGLWTAFTLGEARRPGAGLRDLWIAIAVGLFVAAVVCWTIGLMRGRRGIADEPEPGTWLVTAWQPLGAGGVVAILGGIAFMHLGLVLVGAALTVAATVGWFFFELPDLPASAAGSGDAPHDRAVA